MATLRSYEMTVPTMGVRIDANPQGNYAGEISIRTAPDGKEFMMSFESWRVDIHVQMTRKQVEELTQELEAALRK